MVSWCSRVCVLIHKTLTKKKTKKTNNKTRICILFCFFCFNNRFIDVFSEASYLYQKIVQNDTLAEKYFNASLLSATSVWQRGLLAKGSMIGHGITGNAFMLSLLNKNLENMNSLPSYDKSELEYLGEESQWRCNQFVEWTLEEINMNATRCVYSDASESMWAGCPGIVMIYIQAMQKSWPGSSEPCVPAWEYCI